MKGRQKSVEALRHDEARRRNIRPTELQSTAEYLEEMRPAALAHYPRAALAAGGGIDLADDQLKVETMKTLWVPGVNNLDASLGGFGRWAFAELRDAIAIGDEFRALAEGLVAEKEAA